MPLLDHPPLSEVEGKSLLNKSPLTSDIGLRGHQAENVLIAFSLRTLFHVIRRCHTSYQRKEATNSSNYMWCIRTMTTNNKSNNNKQYSSGIPTLVVTNCSLLDIKSVQQSRKYPGTGNLAMYLGLVKSLFLEKNLQLQHFKSAYILTSL